MSAARRFGGEARADLAQQVVADVVAEAVVDRLEVGEVHHQHRDGFAGAWLAEQLLLQAFDEQRAVREAGEQIVEELVLALLAQLEQLAYGARHDQRGHQVERHRERDALKLDVVAVRGLPPADDHEIRDGDDGGRGERAQAGRSGRTSR